jgi:hypothetical protein
VGNELPFVGDSLVELAKRGPIALIVIDDLHFADFCHRHGQEVSNHLKGRE